MWKLSQNWCFLDKIGPMSGYKPNIDKTEILSYWYLLCRISKTFSIQISDSLLNISVSSCIKIYQKSWIKIISFWTQKWKKILKSEKLIPNLGLTARIETIKVNVRPKFLYLVQTLPIFIPNQLLAEWDKSILRFIWQGQKPCILFKTLQWKRKEAGE